MVENKKIKKYYVDIKKGKNELTITLSESGKVLK